MTIGIALMQKGEPMRLINADALETHEYLAPLGNGNYEYVEVVYKDDIDSMTTIEERKKGEWIEDAETYYKAVNEKGGGVDEDTPFFVDDIACSECLTLFSVIDNCTEGFDFCPACGADMRGEEA